MANLLHTLDLLFVAISLRKGSSGRFGAREGGHTLQKAMFLPREGVVVSEILDTNMTFLSGPKGRKHRSPDELCDKYATARGHLMVGGPEYA